MPALDIHVVVRTITPQFEAALLDWGYSAKEVVGGDPRVRMDKLFSAKFDTKEATDALYSKTLLAIEGETAFVGYVEEEIVTDDVRIARTSTDTVVPPFPEKMVVSAGPAGRHKGCDIHASMVSPPVELTQRLTEAGFYFLVLRKVGLGDVTIFTVQTESVPEGRRLLGVITKYLTESGVFDGMVKFEVTRGIRDFGFTLPPIVLSEHSKISPA